MAYRQLPSGRKADPSDHHGLAAQLLSPVAETRLRSLRRISTRVRHGLGVRRAHGQQLRRQHPRQFHQRLSDDPAADDRRALGGFDHPANRADRKSSTACATDHAQPGRATRGRRNRGSIARRQRARRRAGLDRVRRPRRGTAYGRVRGSTRAPASRSRPESHACAGMVGRASVEAGNDSGRGGARGPAQSRGRERDHAQHRDEPEGDRRGRLDGIVQANLPRRQRFDVRRRVSGNGFRHPHTLSNRGRTTGARLKPRRARYRAPCRHRGA